MNEILNIVSVRVKNMHINPADPQDNTAFSSINKAKARTRELGGAGKVRAFTSKDKAFDFLQEYKKAADIVAAEKAAKEAEEKARAEAAEKAKAEAEAAKQVNKGE